MSETLTPMMQQYRRIKEQLPPGVILFFRLGDFYEMFFEDAKEVAPLLNITLTKRQNAPMCGIPFHAVDGYLARLIRAGKKVAVCEQTEDPASAKGVVRREVARIVTPGTVTEDRILEPTRHNYLVGLCKGSEGWGYAVLDISTGLFWGEEAPGTDVLSDTLRKLGANECVVAEAQGNDPDVLAVVSQLPTLHMTRAEDWTFDYDSAYDCLKRHFQVQSLEGFGCEGRTALVRAAGGILYYVREQLRRETGHIRSFRVSNPSDFLVLDPSTCVHLDLAPMRGSGDSPTLLKALDVTRTAMGARLMRDWILRPLAGLDGVVRRHEAVESFCKDRTLLREVTETLASVRDMERLLAKMVTGSANARDLTALGQSLAALPAIRKLVGSGGGAGRGEGAASAVPPSPREGTRPTGKASAGPVPSPGESVGAASSVDAAPPPRRAAGMLKDLAGAIAPQPELVDWIARAILDEPSALVKEGGMIRDGYKPELDELRRAGTEGRQWIAEYQAREIERTGIKSLKIRHTEVVGFYIEISKAQLDHVPEDYQRRQTLVNAERFVTPQLREYESKVFGAKEKAMALEYELFVEIRDAVAARAVEIQAAADAVAQVDVLAALADRALAFNYVRPKMTGRDRLHIKDGRHPIIEQMPDAERFVPNDTLLDGTKNQLMIITGPNMAGKSTYIRQVALIVVMAQMGSFVPASAAEIGLVDRVFTRVGASDDIARGRSTFMVEMQETANILNNATPRSLIVLDEIGRGTSTFDGISIAWAVAEYLHNNDAVRAKTLFATHYHELTDLALTMPGVKNYNVLVRESGEKIAFLRKIMPGAADKSYGIAVARLAGMPQEVVTRAREILKNLEEGEFAESGQPKIAARSAKTSREHPAQLSLFG